jgi:O-antigen ligase
VITNRHYLIFFALIVWDFNELVSSIAGSSGEGLISIAILIYSLILIGHSSKNGHKLRSGTHKLFVLFLLLYIIIGSVSALLNGNNILLGLRSILPGILIYWVSFSYFTLVSQEEMNIAIHKFIPYLMVISSTALILTFFFEYNLFTGEFLFMDRATGMYANPNRAGNMAVMGQIFAMIGLLKPSNRNKIFYFVLYILSFVAALVTFSKTAFILSFFVGIILVYRLRSLIFNNMRNFIVFVTMIFSVVVVSFFFFTETKNLSSYQAKIIYDFRNLLSGDFNEETTTGRSDLASEGLKKIVDQPLLGYGIGTFSSAKSILKQPIHNMYLAIWAEAGFLTFSVFLFYLLKAILAKRDYWNFNYLKVITIILIIVSVSSHELLVFKPFMFFFGMINAKLN